jgi:hypothetical protein
MLRKAQNETASQLLGGIGRCMYDSTVLSGGHLVLRTVMQWTFRFVSLSLLFIMRFIVLSIVSHVFVVAS